MARKERYLVGLDVGTSKVTAVVGGAHRRRRARRRRARRRRVARHPARRGRQPRGGGRFDQEGDRGSRADGRRRDRLGAPRAVRPAHQGLQQPRRDCRRRQEPRDHPRGRAAGDRRRQGGLAADRPRDPARAAAGLRRRRAGRHRRAGRDDRRAARGERPHHHRQPELDAEHRRVREPRRRERRRDGRRAARGQRVGADRRREGAGRRAGGHRRRHHGHRDLRARQPVAHRGGRHRRRSLHQRHRRRPADAGARRGKDQAEVRLRALGHGRRRRDDGGRERRRPEAAGHGAAHPVGDPAAARRGDLSSGLGRDPPRRLREEPQLRHRADRRRRDPRRHAGDRRTDFRSADPPRLPDRRRRAGRSREQPDLRDRRRPGALRVSAIRAATSDARRSARARWCGRPAGCGDCFESFSDRERPNGRAVRTHDDHRRSARRDGALRLQLEEEASRGAPGSR